MVELAIHRGEPECIELRPELTILAAQAQNASSLGHQVLSKSLERRADAFPFNHAWPLAVSVSSVCAAGNQADTRAARGARTTSGCSSNGAVVRAK
jgi:hypothetical protein